MKKSLVVVGALFAFTTIAAFSFAQEVTYESLYVESLVNDSGLPWCGGEKIDVLGCYDGIEYALILSDNEKFVVLPKNKLEFLLMLNNVK